MRFARVARRNERTNAQDIGGIGGQATVGAGKAPERSDHRAPDRAVISGRSGG
ncbi:hypothetical protein GCM10022251_68210 [Phytohabitans flavus]|uniref:Uncharacterized protein n=1 Tax=Phytohabitans flavus TaxID=1076124 RepID=A0A6F8XQT3_9ACTN|nr:hypothetical protein Pflav_025590 [Phytohabitans flavus]